MMRPGVGKNLLSRRDLAGKYLTEEHDKIDDEMKSSLSVSLLYYCQCIDKIRGKKTHDYFHFIRENTLHYRKMDGQTYIVNQSSPLAFMSLGKHFCMMP